MGLDDSPLCIFISGAVKPLLSSWGYKAKPFGAFQKKSIYAILWYHIMIYYEDL